MKHFTRAHLDQVQLPGRIIQKAVGKDSFSPSGKMSVGFARYSAESGPMEPHQHAEEVVYVLDANDGWVRYGPAKDRLGERIRLESGTILHNPPLEWHVFGYDEGGYLDVLFIYGQVDHIRPEEMANE